MNYFTHTKGDKTNNVRFELSDSVVLFCIAPSLNSWDYRRTIST